VGPSPQEQADQIVQDLIDKKPAARVTGAASGLDTSQGQIKITLFEEVVEGSEASDCTTHDPEVAAAISADPGNY
jgi:hypothetical protein